MTEKELRESYGRDWRTLFRTEAQTIALAGCGKGNCLHNSKLCDKCNLEILRITLQLAK